MHHQKDRLARPEGHGERAVGIHALWRVLPPCTRERFTHLAFSPPWRASALKITQVPRSSVFPTCFVECHGASPAINGAVVQGMG